MRESEREIQRFSCAHVHTCVYSYLYDEYLWMYSYQVLVVRDSNSLKLVIFDML